MSDIYVFSSNEDNNDYSTMGLVGALEPTECTFEETANGDSLITMKHPVDSFGKYTALVRDNILVIPVPVRTTPEIQNGSCVTTVWTYKVKPLNQLTSKNQRTLYKSSSGSGKRKVMNAGDVVTVVYQPKDTTNISRWKVKSKYGTGWIDPNGFELVTEHKIEDNANAIQEVQSPWMITDQLFRIYEVERGLEKVTVSARHITYDLLYDATHYYYGSDQAVSLQTTLDNILGKSYGFQTRFHAYTNVTNTQTGLSFRGKNEIECFLDPEDGVCAKFDVDMIRDNYDLYFLHDPGINRGVRIQYGKNLTGISYKDNTEELVTRIIPTGETKNGEEFFLAGPVEQQCVDSKHINDYPVIHVYYMKCENCKIGDKDENGGKITEAVARARMRAQAQKMFDSGCDLPKIEMSVEFINLGDTEEYKQFKNLENCYLYDYVIIQHPKMNIDVTAQIVKMEWDCLLDRMNSVEIGTVGKTLANTGITSWQIPSGFSGAKIAQETIGSAALRSDIVAAKHIQSDTISANHIQANAVTAGKIAAGAITTDKLDAGSVTAEKIAAGSVEAAKIKAGSITTDKLDAGAVTAEKIAANAVEADKIKAGAVTAKKISANAVTAEKISAEAITSDKIKAGAVDTDKLKAGAVTAEKIASKTITADLIKAKTITADSGIIDDSAIGTAQIADGSITSAKIVELNADLIKTGTLSAERLLLVGDDGVIYKINAASSGLSMTELAKDQYKNYINGTVIVAKSITAAQIAAKTITGNEILAGSITAKEIDVSDLFASEATINELNAMDIRGNKYLQLYVTDKVDGISVGGRNLLRNTNQGTANWNWAMQTGGAIIEEYLDGGVRAVRMTKDAVEQAGWSYIYYVIGKDAYALLEPDTEYIVSMDYKPTVAAPNGITVNICNGSDTHHAIQTATYDQAIPADEWTHIAVPIKTKPALPAFNDHLVHFKGFSSAVNSVHIFKNLKLEKGNKPTDWSPAPEDVNAALNQQAAEFANIVTRIDGDLSSLQSQVDGSITTWFYEVAPTMENVPAKDWTTEDDKNVHLGDLYYDTVTGYCYRWQVQNKVYGWQRITDTDVTKALADAKNAQDTADGKRRVFVVEPTPPYDVGDVWMQGADGDILRCQTKKIEGQSYAAADWVKGSKYTNDDKANEAMAKANANAEAIETNRSELTLTKNNLTALVERTTAVEDRVTTAESKIDQKADSITMSVLERKVDGISVGGRNLYTGTRNFDGDTWMFKSMWTADGSYNDCLVYKYTGQWYGLGQMITLEANTQYTLSAWMKQTDGGTVTYFDGKPNGAATSDKGSGSVVEVGTDWSRCHVTFTISTAETYHPRFEQNVAGATLWIAGLKLEKGNKPTDWSPAPEDPSGSLSVSSDYSKVDINKDRVRIVSKQMEVAVPSDDGEDDVLRVDADGVHAEVVEADRIVSESVVHTQGAASYTPANAGELAVILEDLSGKHLTARFNIDCKNVTSGNYEVANLSGEGEFVLRNGKINRIKITNCGSVPVYFYKTEFSNSETAIIIDNSLNAYFSACDINAAVGLEVGIDWPAKAILSNCHGDCTVLAKLLWGTELRIYGASKPYGSLSLGGGCEVYNATPDPTFAAKASPSIPTTQTVTASLSPTQTYTLRGTSNSDGNKLYQGRYSSSQALRKGVMLFSLPSDLTSADKIDSATLTIKRIGGVGQGGGVSVHVRCYDVPGTLYASKTAYENQTVSIDVTAAVKAMKTNGYTGLMLYNPDTATVGGKSYTASYSRFAGKGESGAPVLKISYRK